MDATQLTTAFSENDVLVLGIETSCDETAAAVVRRSCNGKGALLSNVIRSQWQEHREFGGVVPEIAARAHVLCLDDIIAEALRQSETRLADVDAIAASTGPGLVGGLIVGTVTGQTIALSSGKPFVPVNHLEGHALTVGLTDHIKPPYLLLLVSGGHTQILHVRDVAKYDRLATTIDDALGEAFDKTAKLLGLPQPGGPAVERAAKNGDASRFDLPRPMLGRKEPHFSFAGLKTAVRQRAQSVAPLTEQDVCDLCAAFECAVKESVIDRCKVAMQAVRNSSFDDTNPRHFVVAGGVAANKSLRLALKGLAEENGFSLCVPPPSLCTDNAAMIAWAGAERFVRGLHDPLSLSASVRPRWPLDPDAEPVQGAGVKA